MVGPLVGWGISCECDGLGVRCKGVDGWLAGGVKNARIIGSLREWGQVALSRGQVVGGVPPVPCSTAGGLAGRRGETGEYGRGEGGQTGEWRDV